MAEKLVGDELPLHAKLNLALHLAILQPNAQKAKLHNFINQCSLKYRRAETTFKQDPHESLPIQDKVLSFYIENYASLGYLDEKHICFALNESASKFVKEHLIKLGVKNLFNLVSLECRSAYEKLPYTQRGDLLANLIRFHGSDMAQLDTIESFKSAMGISEYEFPELFNPFSN